MTEDEYINTSDLIACRTIIKIIDNANFFDDETIRAFRDYMQEKGIVLSGKVVIK